MGTGEIVLCDTDVMIEMYRNNHAIISALKEIGQENIAISVVSAAELMYGAFNKKELNQLKKDLNSLILLDLNEKICKVFLEIVSKYVLSYRIKVPDGLIAATALANNISIYTLNLKDYQYIEKINLYRV
jgi:predicted nucleic acid-binding protein